MAASPYSNPATAAIYHRIAAPLQFAAPARDLVDIVNVRKHSVVLDVGTGTGVVASMARKAAGPNGLIIGADAAFEMMQRAPRDAARFVVSRATELPFSDQSFDIVLAGFVVSHFENYERGLAEMFRVCRTGGRIGMSAWGDAANPAAALWNDAAAQYVPRERLDEAFRQHIPCDGWFSRRENVARALAEAHLAPVVVETRYYAVRMTIDEYLISREASVQGLILQDAATSAGWRDFRGHVRQVFEDRFGDIVEYNRDVHFGMGTKP